MQITIDTLSWFDKLTIILSYLKGHPELVEGWSGREDLNLRHLTPHASALPGCATPRLFKLQSPNPNFQINPNYQCPKSKHSPINLIFKFWSLELWSLFGAWCLKFGYCDSS